MTRRRAPVPRAARFFHNQFTQAAALSPVYANEAVAASCFLAFVFLPCGTFDLGLRLIGYRSGPWLNRQGVRITGTPL